ncbi:MAG: hypothetical protein HY741_05260 [Chloroflexi bacterium]|nr:hypothetical protein [Chloroflexota bacterium]
MLAVSPEVCVVGCAPTIQAALEPIAETLPEAIIVAGVSDSGDELHRMNPNEPATHHWGQLLVLFPNIPLIRADLATDALLLITCKHIDARPDSLLAALHHLPTDHPDQPTSRLSDQPTN